MLPAMDLEELNDALAESNVRAREGRALARVMFVATVALAGFLAYVVLAAPKCGGMMCPMFDSPPSPNIGDVTMAVGLAGLLIGLVWMWRIVRAEGDPDARSWRHLHRP
jgi:hypothetical protein